jgi:hypothetical protein
MISFRSNQQPKAMSGKTMLMIGGGQHRLKRGKFHSPPPSGKWLNKLRFSAGSGDSAVGPALFIDGKFTSGQTPGGRNQKQFSSLRQK